MSLLPWVLLILIGISVLVLFFWLLIKRNQTFDASLLGLLTIGVSLFFIAIVQPEKIKYGDVEMVIKETVEVIKQANLAAEKAEKASVLARETISMLLWNTGRLDAGADTKAAKNLIYEIYGQDKGKAVIHEFIKRGIFKLPPEERANELKNASATENSIQSPLIEMMNNQVEWK